MKHIFIPHYSIYDMSEVEQGAKSFSSQEAAMRLKNAKSPEAVEDILHNKIFDNAEWKALGKVDNNYGIVENQAGDPIPALVELIVNSYDAHLMKGFHKLVGTTEPSPENNELPKFSTQEEARDELLNLDESHVELRADGFQPSDREIINFTVIDNGCGQHPDEFEDTFLGLLDPGKYKQDYPFLQGQYGMGSAAVLQFSGGQSFKFICSAAASQQGEWSWSLVRQNKDRARYEYLTFDGEVPSFNGSVESQAYGTFVKIYDYELNVTKTNIGGDTRFQKRLERYLVNPPIQLQLNDERYNVRASKTTGGLRARIDEFDSLVNRHYSITYNFDDDRLGIRDIDVITFKDDEVIEKLKQNGEISEHRDKGRFVRGRDHREIAVLYTVNGQTHGNEGSTFIKNRCSKPRVGDDTLVIVDCSDLAGTDMVDLFQPTRDRIKNTKIGNELRAGVKNAIENDDWLTQEEDRRRQKLADEESDEILDESLQSILEEDPDLQRFFESGDKATTDIPSDENASTYNPPSIPNTFNIIETYDPGGDHEFHDTETEGTFTVEVPVNRNPQVRFYLNAPNKYLSDSGDGEMHVKPTTEAVKWSNLNKGVLRVSLDTPDSYQPGDALTLVLNITRPDNEALTQRVGVEFIDKQEGNKSESDNTPEPEGSAGLSPPDINRIEEDDWDNYNPSFDEHDIVRIMSTGDSVSNMDIYVNMDASAIKRFLQNRNLRPSGKEFVEKRYVISVALYSVAMYVEFKEQYDDSEEFIQETPPEELVSTSMRGMGQVLLHSVAPEQLLSEY